ANEINVATLKGNGDGSFGNPVNAKSGLTSVQEPVNLITGDFNSDGKLDLLVDTAVTHVFSPVYLTGTYLLLGQGDGTFANRGVVSDGVVAAADMNGDGRTDLVVFVGDLTSAFSQSLAIRLGRSDGTFQSVLRSNSV